MGDPSVRFNSYMASLSWKCSNIRVFPFCVTSVTQISIAQWMQLDSLKAGGINALAVSPTGNIFAAADSGLLVSRDQGNSWTTLLGSDSIGYYLLDRKCTKVFPTLSGTIFTEVITYEDGPNIQFYPFCSTDNGITWDSIGHCPILTDSYGDMYSFNYDGRGGSRMARSTNNGDSWGDVLGLSLELGGIIEDSAGGLIALDHNNVYRSIDRGITWNKIREGFTQYYVQKVLVGRNGYLFAAGDEGVFRSTDLGITWTKKTYGMFWWMATNSVGDLVVASPDTGNISLSTDNGESWRSIEGPVGGFNERQIAFDKNGYLLMGTRNGILYRNNLSTLGISKDVEQLPTSYDLDQNYPNPFNPSTTIKYQIPNQSLVTLKIFDLLGREVAVLVNEKKDAGNYSVQWNASGFSSGIYFYRFEAGGRVDVRKMLIVK
jgi:photosystem II stability/assembly factor-like uncharacterized protein